MLMKNIMEKVMAISFSALTLLTGCAQSNSPSETATSTGQTDSPITTAASTSRGDSLGTNATEPETTAYLYEGQYKMFDPQVIKEIFIPELDSLGEEDFISEWTEIGADSVRIDNPELGAGLYNCYWLKDGRRLFWDAGTIVFENNLEGESAGMNTSVFNVTPTEEELREQYPLTEIEGLTSEEALSMAQEIMDKLDIPCVGEPQIYTCPGEENYWDGNDFFPTKDAYYILYPTAIDGAKLPYIETHFAGVKRSGDYGYVQFIISADGLENFDAEFIFDYHRKESCAIISQEQAAEIMENTYTPDLAAGKSSISDGRLTYIAAADMNTGNSLLYPAWEFVKSYDVEYLSGDGSTVKRVCFQRFYVDAQSGKIMS